MTSLGWPLVTYLCSAPIDSFTRSQSRRIWKYNRALTGERWGAGEGARELEKAEAFGANRMYLCMYENDKE